MTARTYILLTWLAMAVACFGQVSQVQVVNFQQQPITNRLCKTGYAGPSLNPSNAVVVQDLGIQYTDTNGWLYYSNLVIGFYIVTVAAPPAQTQFGFAISNAVTGTNVISPVYFWNGTNWQANNVYVLSIANVSGAQSGLSGSLQGGVLSLTNTNSSGGGGGSVNIYSGTVTLTNGSSNFSATFSALGWTPSNALATVQQPIGGGLLFFPVVTNYTSSSISGVLSGITDLSGYIVNYQLK